MLQALTPFSNTQEALQGKNQSKNTSRKEKEWGENQKKKQCPL